MSGIQKFKMKIENAEISLLKASQIQDGDVLLVRMSKKYKEQMSAEKAHKLFEQIKSMAGDKQVGIFFFPKDLEISIIRDFLEKADKLIPNDSVKMDSTGKSTNIESQENNS